ncbi:hypothetical protein N792_01170 [Lysobacter concretionis Ko07 = DSM 16239]|uniref:CzcB-like barrel-sandwich hybrid domain-containing protein n=1 Tax=Lysobacter concretionis Ko07 = DSM 16239 TaxID=1122185 RepID=A0A0A0EPJ7_9GAMM|nr:MULTISPECIES: efflux RND transporter periplasmic adaptor subunit [Lysobacter]KGM52876.1 hypothetical protein N792_01170 [Lysobacter concretionis Ko07 = DSM 16239]QOD91315.1 efflux RND transporter periplasmic adaptor subunit [Lysobacter sp. CW239]
MPSRPAWATARTGLILGGAVLAAALAWVLLRPSVPPQPRAVAAPVAAADASVQLTAQQERSLGIAVEPSTQATSVPLTGLPAEATPPLDASTHVAVPFAGVVTRVLVDEGTPVKRGQPMLRLHSRELLAARAELIRSSSEAGTARRQADRDAQLVADGIIPASRHERSRAQATAADAAHDHARRLLSQVSIPADASGDYELTAPQDGLVLRRNVVPGQSMEAMSPAFVIADASHLDITFTAPLSSGMQLRPGLAVDLPDGTVARIVAIGAQTDIASQSLRVRARSTDATALVAGQQFAVSVRLPAPQEALRVPSRALLPHGDRQLLFVQEETGYRGVVVDALGSDNSHTVVLAPGLQAGARVVVRGTSALRTLAPVAE